MDDPKKIYAKIAVLAFVIVSFALPLSGSAQTIYQIWHPNSSQNTGNSDVCVFRKKMSLIDPIEAIVYVTASGEYELFVNGQPVSPSGTSNTIGKHAIAQHLKSGVNLLAVKVTNDAQRKPGVGLKFRVREDGETRWRSLTSDDSWITQMGVPQDWNQKYVNERKWKKSQIVKPAGFDNEQIVFEDSGKSSFQLASTSKKVTKSTSENSPPTSITAHTKQSETQATQPEAGSTQKQIIPAETSQSKPTESRQVKSKPIQLKSPEEKRLSESVSSEQRFAIASDFKVEQVMGDDETGSVIAMAFNEFGQLILSREGGPLMVADVTKEPGDTDRIKVLCNEVNTCQGILPLNGKLFVTGKGPSGVGLYRLHDPDRDGVFKVDEMLFKFQGDLSEHGPHAVRLGPDGMIYVIIGNASRCLDLAAPSSPYSVAYEGDLIKRVEDPGGHAIGVKAPGGTVIRASLSGDIIETVAGGIRNAYDFVFDQYGELFLHDSDLETNIGMAWYRPTRIYHVPGGAELGWRSGWAKFPNYFTDVVPPVIDTGRGSPSGAVLYQHFQFPARYHNAMFFADWSEGRILAAHQTPQGASYTLEVEEFLAGKPLNVTDVDVGMDGTLFFSTGGRGTAGGVFRVAWKGEVPDELYKYSNRFEEVIRMPQPNAPWARQATALIKRELKDTWSTMLEGIALDDRNDQSYRLRSLDLMFFHGPYPTDDLINQLKTDSDYQVRSRIASICGLKGDRPRNVLVLEDLVSDEHPLVRRKAAESYLRINKKPPIEKTIAMLGSQDRIEVSVARRLLQRMPEAAFRQTILTTDQVDTFIHGSIALMTKYPRLDTSYEVLARASNFMDGYLSDAQFADVLRVTQIALFTGKVDPLKIGGFGDRVANEFPAGSGILNKQLAMLMAYMGNANIDDRINDYFKSSENNMTDKLFVAMQLQSIGELLSDNVRFSLIGFLEKSIYERDGSTYRAYISEAVTELAKDCRRHDQLQHVLKNGADWPNAMLQTFFTIQSPLNDQQVNWVIQADQEMTSEESPTTRRVRMGVIAMLAESNSQIAYDYLRKIWQERPNYRNEISLGLAQEPTGQNWAFLVTSLPILDDTIGREVAVALKTVNRRPTNARQYRDLIQLGYRLRANGANEVAQLLQHWTSNLPEVGQPSGNSWDDALQFWNDWYTKRWPNETPVSVDSLPRIGQYTADQVLAHLDQFEHRGQVGTGRYVFKKANCVACHKIRGEGASFGPDLTNLANRFSRREVLESIIHPSKVVSDQYGSKKVVTIDGQQLFGMLTRDAGGAYLLLDPDGKTTRIDEQDIEEIAASELSSMPDGLLDTLTMEEILHLFTYLYAAENKPSTAGFSEDNQFQR